MKFNNLKPDFKFNNNNAEIYYYSNFFDKVQSNRFLDEFINEIEWRQNSILLFGKKHSLPRLEAWYGDRGVNYSYSGIKHSSTMWSKSLMFIRNRVEKKLNFKFNSVLMNYYRTGLDSNGWHSDDEKELGRNPVIASISFGSLRKFKLRHKTIIGGKTKLDLELEHGSLLIMSGETQHFWKHCIPKTKAMIKPRVNLTFRLVSQN